MLLSETIKENYPSRGCKATAPILRKEKRQIAIVNNKPQKDIHSNTLFNSSRLSPLSPSSGFEQVNKRLQLVGTGLLLLEQGHEVVCSPVIRLQGCNLSAAVGEGTLQLSELGALGRGQSLQLGA